MRRSFPVFVGLLVAAPTLLAAPLSGAASLSMDGDIPVVLTPARLSQPQSQVPASVTVIDRTLIEASGAREVYQLLQLVPDMLALNVDGNVPTVSYHATQARDVRRMLVLIDGRSEYRPGLARVLWNDMPIAVEDIERIEVTRGPASPAYGANAFQGVINIITKHPDDVDGTTVATRQGNDGINDWRVTSAAQGDGKAVRITVNGIADDGYNGEFFDTSKEVQDFVTMRDGKNIASLNLRSAFDLGSNDSLEFLAGGSKVHLQRPKEQSDFYSVMDFTDNPDEYSDHLFGQLVWQHRFSARHELKLQTYIQRSTTANRFGGCFKLPVESFPGAAPDPVAALYFSQYMRDVFLSTPGNYEDALAVAIPAVLSSASGAFQPAPGAGPLCADFDININEQRYDLEVQDTFFVDDYTRVVLGANLRKDRATSETYLSGTEENLSRRLFGNLEVHLADPLYLDVGGYWEQDQLNGTSFSSRRALIYEFLPANSLRLVASNALRTADIYEKRANVHLVPSTINEPYASDPQGTLGWSSPELFIVQNAQGTNVMPERIQSREIGYFGQWQTLQWDLRVYWEKLRDLVSDPINPFDFEPNNDGWVDMRGREGQLSWRVTPAHLLRMTAGHRHSWSNNRIERVAVARNTGSLLWRWDISHAWMTSIAGYLGNDYNSRRYERLDGQLKWKGRVDNTGVELGLQVQHDLTDDAVVFEDNVYKDGTRYWVSAALTF